MKKWIKADNGRVTQVIEFDDVVTNNGNVVDNPSITYSSSDETVATVSDTDDGKCVC